MVGLPARGKSTMARKMSDALLTDGFKVGIFNNGALRRQWHGDQTAHPQFFSPRNPEGVRLREQFARMNLEMARTFLQQGGDLAIIDAANVTRGRRRLIEEAFPDVPVLFVECVNDDQEVLEANLRRKSSLEEFSHLTPAEALESFRRRIGFYASIYEPLADERNRVVVDSFQGRILSEEMSDVIPNYDRLRDLIVTRFVENLFLVRHGETYFNLEDRIGGDSELTPRGWEQAEALAEHFSRYAIPLIFTSAKKRAIQTAQPIARRQGRCAVVPLGEFDEIHSGVCEEMSYGEIRTRMPEVARAREKDKYGYVYPGGGESYATMEERVERGVRKAFYLCGPDDNVMIVGHRGVNRMILAHFVYRRREDVPYIYMPQNGYYRIQITPHKKLFELIRY
jgi:broad specificity phosphatase PhoE